MKLDNNYYSTNYFHETPESLLSKIVKFVFWLLNWKNSIEKHIRSGKINQKAASMPKSLLKISKVELEVILGRKVWTLKSKKNAQNNIILYIHGGAYIYNIKKVHWQLIEQLLRKTGATIIIPDYPLAPQFNSSQVLSFIYTVYQVITEKYLSKSITFIGDSAGGGLALSFTQSLRNDGYLLPNQLILLSPWLDITMSNPGIITVDRYDKMLGIKGLKLAGAAYAGDLNPMDYRVSPIFGNFEGLPNISIFIGTHDLFIADSRKLKLKLESANISFNYFEYPNMMHIWTLIPALKEAKDSINQVIELLD